VVKRRTARGAREVFQGTLGSKLSMTARRTPPFIDVVLMICGLFSVLGGDLFAQDKPQSAFDWGYRLRLRQEYTTNNLDYSNASFDDNNYLRVRSQLWGSWTQNPQLKLYVMLNNEHRHWFKSNKGLEDQDFEIHEVIFENLYLEAKSLGGTPFGFTIGRQNLFYGEGFICWDGGPLDGSRTAYFNAAVGTAVFGKRRLDVHFISDPEKDEYLPIINDQDQSLVEWDETGAGLYYQDDSFEGQKAEAYYFYKSEKDDDNIYPESNIHTVGARFSGKGFDRLTFAAEGALQLGDRGSQDRFGYGGYISGKYALPVEQTPLAVSAGSVYLSGDNVGTASYEGWDPVYSRWPKWSELYIYSLAKEKGPAYWQNLAMPWLGLDFKPEAHISLEGRLYMMWAPEATGVACPAVQGPACPMTDEFAYRGTLSIVKLNWTLNDYLAGYLLWEAVQPGDYYVNGNNTAHFLRWEVMFKY
jgi:hypothetical protein